MTLELSKVVARVSDMGRSAAQRASANQHIYPGSLSTFEQGCPENDTTPFIDPKISQEDLTELVLAGPEGHLAQIRDSENRRVFPQTAAQAPAIPWEDNDQERVFRTVPTDDALYRILVQEVVIMGQTYRVLLASSLESLLVVRDRLAASFLVATPIGTLGPRT